MEKVISTSLFITLFFSITAFGQSWSEVDARAVSQKGLRNINPDRFIIAEVNDNDIKDILWSAPSELKFDPASDKHTHIDIMLADGSIDKFSIVRYQMMEPNLALRFDHIRTFHGISTTNPYRRVRINYTVHGLRAVVTDEEGQTYIDHYQRNDRNHKIIYRRKDFRAQHDWECEFHNEKIISDNADKQQKSFSRSGDCVFRSYRFAITATGEYSNYHGAQSDADVDLVMSAIVTTIDRVNDVFEQDITMRLILIDNTDDIFYYDPASDPFTGNSAGDMIGQNQSNTNTVIGSANYDLGHIVSTGGSGLASLGVVCSDNFKARGVTGIAVPEGDPFDIDYVAHEIGHQLGATHTQNNSCNRTNSTAMEPGSASTIMGYAGICAPNVQNNSDAYFHAISIQQMNNELTSNNCNGVIGLNNAAPVSDPLVNKSIPKSTPFVLDVNAIDGDSDPLTYCWEQMDNEVGPVMPPASTNAQGPMFRTNFGTADSKRYFPKLSSIVNNTTTTWETLPSVDRNMDFRVTVRDNSFAPGCTDESDITIDVEGNAGPFLVTSQNTATEWLETQTTSITWDVANTDAAPVSCSNVDILLSYDGGMTYNEILIANTPNDGSENITVPIGVTTTARVMVKCSDNVFFDINNTNITINSGAPSYALIVNPTSGSTCETASVTFDIESSSIQNYNTPINLSLTNLPIGANATITPNPIIPGNNATVTINNLNGQAGSYSLDIEGQSGSINKSATYGLDVISSTASPSLISPADGAEGVVVSPVLSWNSVSGASMYEYQVSTSPNGVGIVNTGNTNNTLATVSIELDEGSDYYWRVRATSICGVTPWTVDRTFKTAVCFTYTATDLPIGINSAAANTIQSVINISDRGIITDLNVNSLNVSHTYVNDLTFTLTAYDDTDVLFFSRPCFFENNIDINFDDEAANNQYPCPPVDGLTYQPDNPLTPFDNKQMKGSWVLTVADLFPQDGGSLQSWGIELCLDDYCDITVDESSYQDINGSLLRAIDCAMDGDTIILESAIANSNINTTNSSILIDKSIVIIANGSDNITIISESTAPLFVIESGKTVTLEGFKMENLDTNESVINNSGNLILRDVTIVNPEGMSSVINQNNGILTLEGDCVLETEE